MAPHRLIALTDYLLANRHRFLNRTIIDCLALARLDPGDGRRYSAEELMEYLQVNSKGHLSLVLRQLTAAGLLLYQRGGAGTGDGPGRGYLFRRIGPEVMP